ncbi:MAG: DUF418 domain-containing protein [Halieaceae bacterium]|jgi:uncharacterized protein|nr:DUF418 domain-containing protein [Halieaceae bacterium]MBT5005382.1 DUF418 domain-containing protein [Halieaceae bacterium]MBT6126209.1 DUF418 domain-containing protein [Halieaceae bacterium]MBT7720543.1 DUF418 domain-containing protein [Halieaceae bacterium]
MTTNSSGGRLEFLDVLRGVALFGILTVNVFSFGAESAAWVTAPDRVAWHIKYFFFESKFWSLYSLLFGMGFYLQVSSEGYSMIKSIRRLTALMLIGCLHALLFEGDILMLYAELGLLLLVAYRWPTAMLMSLGVVLLMSFPLGHFFAGDRGDDWPAKDHAEALEWLQSDRADAVEAVGTLPEIAVYHAQFIPERFWEDWQYPDSGLLVLAHFIFGFCFMRGGWQWMRACSGIQLRRMCLGFWSLGIVLMCVERYLTHRYGYSLFEESVASEGLVLLGDLTYLLATVSLSAAWFLSVWIWVDCGAFRRLRASLATAGRLSLSLYLTQTLVFTSVFYGYGLGYAYQWGPLSVICFAVFVFFLQLLLSAYWSRYFIYGPVEWLWRVFTYFEWEPIRRSPVNR